MPVDFDRDCFILTTKQECNNFNINLQMVRDRSVLDNAQAPI